MFKFKFEIENEKTYINHVCQLTLNSNRGKEMKHASQAYLISQKEKYSNHVSYFSLWYLKIFGSLFSKNNQFYYFFRGEKKIYTKIKKLNLNFQKKKALFLKFKF